MRRTLPDPAPDDVASPYRSDDRPAPSGRPWVMTNMITSVDGATAVGGRSGPLGGPADRAVFHALRGLADVILVGAGTAGTEHYRPPPVDEATRTARLARGQQPTPRLVVVSARLSIDPSEAFLDEGTPLVWTRHDAAPQRWAPLADRAERWDLDHDDGGVDLAAGLARLAADGVALVLCEGGPHLNGTLLEADLVDEVCQTVAPMLVGGPSARLVAGPESVRTLRLDRLLESDGLLLTRWLVERS